MWATQEPRRLQHDSLERGLLHKMKLSRRHWRLKAKRSRCPHSQGARKQSRGLCEERRSVATNLILRFPCAYLGLTGFARGAARNLVSGLDQDLRSGSHGPVARFCPPTPATWVTSRITMAASFQTRCGDLARHPLAWAHADMGGRTTLLRATWREGAYRARAGLDLTSMSPQYAGHRYSAQDGRARGE